MRHMRLRDVCSPKQPSQPVGSALSAKRHTGVCKAIYECSPWYTLGHKNNREMARSWPAGTPARATSFLTTILDYIIAACVDSLGMLIVLWCVVYSVYVIVCILSFVIVVARLPGVFHVYARSNIA